MCTDRHGHDEHDAIQNCRMTESVELCAQIGMMIMLVMQFKIAESQDLMNCLQILTSRRKPKPAECQNL